MEEELIVSIEFSPIDAGEDADTGLCSNVVTEPVENSKDSRSIRMNIRLDIEIMTGPFPITNASVNKAIVPFQFQLFENVSNKKIYF